MPFGLPITTSASAGRQQASVPVDASFPRRCIRPIPTNTVIVKRVSVDSDRTDIYYQHTGLPGAPDEGQTLRWVERIRRADPANNIAGGCEENIERVDPETFEPRAGGNVVTDFFAKGVEKLAQAANVNLASLDKIQKYAIYAVAGFVVIAGLTMLFQFISIARRT